MLSVLGEYWRFLLAGVPGAVLLTVFSTGRRVPRWLWAGWALLIVAVGLAWAVRMSWPGTIVLFVALIFIAVASWMNVAERRERAREGR
ncbi:hypothetical protein ACFWY9_08300 [Amycolatopsis sp. NPDC059027]|uniref:hypothetical protein n=1 Tax=unclassified Amycolatopsis TaxID=2618356 RepID=UPI00366B2D89